MSMTATGSATDLHLNLIPFRSEPSSQPSEPRDGVVRTASLEVALAVTNAPVVMHHAQGFSLRKKVIITSLVGGAISLLVTGVFLFLKGYDKI